MRKATLAGWVGQYKVVQSMVAKLTIPGARNFANLALERELVTHRFLFLPAPLGVLCLYNGLDPEQILASPDLSYRVIVE